MAHTAKNFYPRSPCGERPETEHPIKSAIFYFYPRSPCGERRVLTPINRAKPIFLSTLSLRRATYPQPKGGGLTTFLSTLSLRRATTWTRGSRITYVEFLSTLSLRRATPRPPSPPKAKVLYFYPRSPCGERLNVPFRPASHLSISIHALLAESDVSASAYYSPPPNFYPRSPCGERREPTAFRTPHHKFLSTLSLRRATN